MARHYRHNLLHLIDYIPCELSWGSNILVQLSNLNISIKGNSSCSSSSSDTFPANSSSSGVKLVLLLYFESADQRILRRSFSNAEDTNYWKECEIMSIIINSCRGQGVSTNSLRSRKWNVLIWTEPNHSCFMHSSAAMTVAGLIVEHCLFVSL